MPQPKKHASDAERQFAYRQRKRRGELVRGRNDVGDLARELRREIEAAAAWGDVNAELLVGESDGECLKNLLHHWRELNRARRAPRKW